MKAGMDAAAEEDARREGLASLGIVEGQTIDVEKMMTEGRKKDEEATKKAADALERWNTGVRNASEHLRLTIFDLHRFGAIELPNVESSLKGVDTETHNLASLDLPQLGISLYDVGQTGVKSFGDLRTTAQRFDDAIQQVGRDLPMMVADAIRSGDWERSLDHIGSQIGARLGAAIGGPLGEAIGSLLPQIGQGIADFFGKLFHTSGLADGLVSEVEDAVKRAKALIDGQKGAIDEVANATRSAGARTMDELQHAADVARKAYEEAFASGKFNQENLNKLYLAFQQALANAGSEAAKAWLEANDAAAAGAKKVDAALQKLIDRRDELTKAISQEAPEAEMGVIEQMQRAQLDAVEQQIKDAQRAADAAADAQSDAAAITKEKWGDTSKVLKDELSAAGDDAAAHIKGAFDFTLHIPIAFDTPGLPVVPMASGGSGTAWKPTLFLAGERGPEPYAFGDAARSGGGDDQTLPAILDALARLPRAISRSVKDSLVGVNG
jgi:hypothetical protein